MSVISSHTTYPHALLLFDEQVAGSFLGASGLMETKNVVKNLMVLYNNNMVGAIISTMYVFTHYCFYCMHG